VTQFATSKDGARIAYDVTGDGHPVVLVHGFASSREQNWRTPGWIDAQGSAAMIEPVLATADLLAAGPDGTAVLYDRAYGLMQWRDAAGKVSAQGVFNSGAAPIVALGYDGQGRQWAVESAGGAYSLVRLSLG